VFYIDGNDEHADHWHDLTMSYQDLARRIKKIPNVIYLQDNVVVIDGVAILATNGWWGFDFGNDCEPTQSAQWYQSKWTPPLESGVLQNIGRQATFDYTYLRNSVKRLQTHNDVKHVIMVTHTVPLPQLIEHDIDLNGTFRFNCMGNPHLQMALEEDTERKIKTWAFGHYHRSVDRDFGGIRYVSNPRGRGNTPWSQPAYYPKRIEVEI
jgi:hypothetical protein